MIRIFRVLPALLLLVPAPVLAWSSYAHRLSARITMAHLSPAARAEVRRIIAQGGAAATPQCQLASFEDASTWPDCVRNDKERFGHTAPWHYQNLNVCQPFDITAKCPDGDCVTAQVPRHLAVLKNRKASPAERAAALAYFIHFMQDLHQPMHVGDKGDRGGNDQAVAYGAYAPSWLNLHGIWDNALAERSLTEPPAIAPASPTPAEQRLWQQGSIEDWAREGWEISRTIAYPGLPGVPDACSIPSRERAQIDQAYLGAARNSIRLQVQRAGIRTAMLLNKALAR
jgi:hypothetical protein